MGLSNKWRKRHYSFPRDPVMPVRFGPSCRSDRPCQLNGLILAPSKAGEPKSSFKRVFYIRNFRIIIQNKQASSANYSRFQHNKLQVICNPAMVYHTNTCYENSKCNQIRSTSLQPESDHKACYSSCSDSTMTSSSPTPPGSSRRPCCGSCPSSPNYPETQHSIS